MKIEDLAGNYCIFSSDEEDFEMEICDTVEYENKTYCRCQYPDGGIFVYADLCCGMGRSSAGSTGECEGVG